MHAGELVLARVPYSHVPGAPAVIKGLFPAVVACGARLLLSMVERRQFLRPFRFGVRVAVVVRPLEPVRAGVRR